MKKAAIRYLCTYMSIALAILILLMPIYSASIKNAKTRLKLEAANIAESNLSHLSSEIQSMGILAKTVQNDQNYIKLGYSHLDRIEVMTSTSLRKTLSNLLAPNDFVKDVLISPFRSGTRQTATPPKVGSGSSVNSPSPR